VTSRPFTHKVGAGCKNEPVHVISDSEMQRREEYNYILLEDEALIILEDDSCDYLVLEDSFFR